MKTISVSVRNWKAIKQIRQQEQAKNNDAVINGLILCYQELKQSKDVKS